MAKTSRPPVLIIILTVIFLPFAIFDLVGDLFLFNQLSFYCYLPIVVLNIGEIYSFVEIWRLKKRGILLYILCYLTKYLSYHFAGAKISNISFIVIEPLIMVVVFIIVEKRFAWHQRSKGAIP